MSLKRFKITYNPYFHLPLLGWIAGGGLLLALYNKRELFAVVNTHFTPIADFLMYYATWMGQPQVIIPILVGLLLVPSLRTWWYFLTGLVCNITPLLIQQILKVMLQHPRPLKLFGDDKAWIHNLDYWPQLVGKNSFPSGHSQGAFSFFCFLSLLLPARYRAFGFLFFLLALSVCYSRLYLAAHFLDDVYTGSIIGAVTTTLLFTVMKKYEPALTNK